MYKQHNIAIGADHAGYELKCVLIDHLQQQGHVMFDLGANDSSLHVDYPDYAHIVSDYLFDKIANFGILICGTGVGMSIASNRLSHIRAALCTSVLVAEQSRLHNNANILVLGARVVTEQTAKIIVNKFFTTEFEGGRHLKRLNKIN